MIYTLQKIRYLETSDAATSLGRSLYTVRKWCRQGRFRGATKFGRTYVIPEASVLEVGELVKAKKSSDWTFVSRRVP